MNLGLGLANLGGGPNVYDVIIIGGGPAGASAAIYTARADLRTLVIDKGMTAGALGITSKISNYPGVPGPVSGVELVEIMRQQAKSFGAEFLTDKVVGLDIASDPKMVMAGTNSFQAKAIILATGSMGRTSSVPGEVELLGRGVSYCATCDGAFFRDKPVAVIGNNDEAIEEALFLTKFASQVYLVVPTPALKAQESLAAEITHHEKVTLMLGTRLKRIEGAGQVTGVRVHPRGGEESVLPVDGAFVYLQGGQPITDYLMGQLKTSAEGCLVVDAEMQTAVPGVFAVGDLLCSHIKQAVIAAADGVIAAVAVDKFVHNRKQVQIDWN
ncbi:MAG: FAD-dependent oxidoreductase [Ardenticatenaceae bacterium]|nr:FAD-dependent oxidoreductase [Ardenticatenaceae bacterium]MCB9443417.1 FAD-dependent oxidoreductase [Ardenticatenaceae bacterium]